MACRLGSKSRSEMKMVLSDDLGFATAPSCRKRPAGVSVPLIRSLLITSHFLVCVAAAA